MSKVGDVAVKTVSAVVGFGIVIGGAFASSRVYHYFLEAATPLLEVAFSKEKS